MSFFFEFFFKNWRNISEKTGILIPNMHLTLYKYNQYYAKLVEKYVRIRNILKWPLEVFFNFFNIYNIIIYYYNYIIIKHIGLGWPSHPSRTPLSWADWRPKRVGPTSTQWSCLFFFCLGRTRPNYLGWVGTCSTWRPACRTNYHSAYKTMLGGRSRRGRKEERIT